jgi:hypothetical protein
MKPLINNLMHFIQNVVGPGRGHGSAVVDMPGASVSSS